MGFFNPGLLWFAAGGAIPIIIHLLHRQKFRRVRWAAMEFLLAALKKTQRRLRLENLLLLLLRILVLVCLALAIARPFFEERNLLAVAGETDVHHLFAVDVSYSTAYKAGPRSVLDEAKEEARKILDAIRASSDDKFTLVAASTWPEAKLDGLGRKAAVAEALDALEPSHYGSRLLPVFRHLRDLVDKSRNRDQRIYFFTDLQRGGWEFADEREALRFAELLKDLTARDNIRLFIHDVGVRDALNRAVVDLRADDRVVTTKRKTRFRAAVHNFSSVPTREVTVTFYVDDTPQVTRTTALPPNATTELDFEYPFTSQGHHAVRVGLEPDYLDVDDSRHLALDVRRSLRGLVVDGEPKGEIRESETFALNLALDPTREGRYFSITPRTVELFGGEKLDEYDFVVLANVSTLTSDKVAALEEFVRRGGGLFLTLGPSVDVETFNAAFWKDGQGLSPTALVGPTGRLPEGLDQGVERRIGKFDVDHPVFRTFRDNLRAAIYSLVFYRYFTTKGHDDLDVLASFDDDAGSPAFLRRRYGQGKVILFTSTVDAEWNAGIVGHPPYLVLVWRICEFLAMRDAGRRNLQVGDLIHLELPGDRYAREFLLETPGDGVVTLPARAPEEGEKFFRLFYPQEIRSDSPTVVKNEGVRHAGIYEITRQAEKEEDRRVALFAVNVPPRAPAPELIHAAEGNLDRIPPDEIRRRYPELRATFVGGDREATPEDVGAPRGGGIWKQLLYLVLGFLMLETILAWLFGRAKQ